MRHYQIIAISRPGSRRRTLLESHLSVLGLHAVFLPAVFIEGPAAADNRYDHATRRRQLGYDLTSGEVGCFLAHKTAWEAAAASDVPCLILEDDARLSEALPPKLGELAKVIAGTKIILRLFSQRHPRAKLWRRLPCGLDIVRPLTAGHSAVAYLIDPTAAKELLRSSGQFWQTVDDHMDDETGHDCVSMHVRPEQVYHDDENCSLIGERRKPPLPPLARARREWHRIIRRLRQSWRREKILRALGLRWYSQ